MDEKLYINNINILKEIDSITSNDINKIYNIENIETNNEVDTSFSKPDTYISIPVTVNFSQYLGEELVEYTE